MESAADTAPSLFPGPVLRPDWRWGALAPWGYGLIMADPPWHYDVWSEKGIAKSPLAHYRTMTDDDIAALPVGDLVQPDCLLWLWATWPKLPLALRCLEAWGARYVTGGAWDKKRWGTGYVLRSVCEPFLIGAWGEPAADGRSVPNLIHESRRRHSEKPEAAYAAAERLLPGVRRVELFSRRARAGWDVWGDEVEGVSVPTSGKGPGSSLRDVRGTENGDG